MAVEGVGATQRSRAKTAPASDVERRQPASQLRAAHQRAARKQAYVVTQWLRQLASESGYRASSRVAGTSAGESATALVSDRPHRGP